MTTAVSRKTRLTSRQQQRFVAMLPAIQRAAERRFRKMPSEERNDLIAEVVAIAFAMFVRLVERGKCDRAYATPLAAYGCRQVVVGRRLATPLNVNDVTSPACRRRKGVTVLSLSRRDRRSGEWKEILVEDRRSTPADIAAARIDVPAFFQSLSRRDRRIALKLANGESTTRVARLFKLSMGRISQLRRELSDAWHRFHGDEPQAAAATA